MQGRRGGGLKNWDFLKEEKEFSLHSRRGSLLLLLLPAPLSPLFKVVGRSIVTFSPCFC